MNTYPTFIWRSLPASTMSSVVTTLRFMCASAVVIFVVLGIWSKKNENTSAQNYQNSQKSSVLNKVPFDPFTGISLGGIDGSSGKRFQDSECRSWAGKKLELIPPSEKVKPKDEGKMCEQWVVITTINHPTETIKHIDAVEGWCQVVVFDKKTPTEKYTELNNTVILNVEDQDKFMTLYNLKSIQLMPWNHFGRKNVGFLYAIAHGAKIIYDTDDDNIPLRGLDPKQDFVELESAESTFNVYNHFLKEGKIWPRGFPLEDINKEEKKPNCCKMVEDSVFVRQHLAQHDPDVDAIYRLTAKLPYYFNTEGKGLVLPQGTFVPYNAQATFHKYQAFFGLLLPITVHGRVSDIWRSYFSQRLMWLAGGSVAFLPPLVTQHRNVHDYLADFHSELPLYIKAGQLVSFLGSWQPRSDTLDSAMWSLAVGMYEHCYWEEDDVNVVAAWIQDLHNIGYTFPRIKTSGSKEKCRKAECRLSIETF